jgi:hypothetical protein
MAIRKTTLSLLYTSPLSTGWTRALRSFIDEGVAALCIRQWQRAPIALTVPVRKPRRS